MLKLWYVYIVQCADGSLYTGITNDLEKRIKSHNLGKGAKAVRGKLPVKLVFKEEFIDKVLAAKREVEVKSWNRTRKLELIKNMVVVAQW